MSTVETVEAEAGDTIYVCPACGTRYAEEGECTNGHPAVETVPYVKAEVEAFDQAQAAAAAALAAGETPTTDFAWPEPAGGAVVPANAGADPHALAEAGLLTVPGPVPAVQVTSNVPAAPAPVVEAAPAVEAQPAADLTEPVAPDGSADLSQPVAPPPAGVEQPAEQPAAPAEPAEPGRAVVDQVTVAQAFADLEANIGSLLAQLKAHLGI